MSHFSGERLFKHQVFAQESRVADESYSLVLRRNQEIKETLKVGAYAGLSLGLSALSVVASWKISERAAQDVLSLKLENVWIYPLALYGLIKGGEKAAAVIRRLRPLE